MKICVIGAGVIGVTTALILARAGHEITVIDAQGDVALGASHANGAQLAFTHVDPLASLSTLSKLPRFFAGLDIGSKIGIPGQLHEISWGLAFLRNALPHKFQSNLQAHIGLAVQSMRGFETIFNLLGKKAPAITGQGKIVVAHNQRELDAMKKTMEAKQDGGLELRELGRAECLAVEPGLDLMTDSIVGGLYAPRDVALDPVQYCKVLRDHLAKNLAVQFHFGQTLTSLAYTGQKITGVQIGADLVKCDHVVVCAGNGARQLVDPLGVKLPILPGRGYSLTLTSNASTPTTSITDLKRKIVFSSLGERLRIAGFIDFFQKPGSEKARQLELLTVARELWPGIADYDNDIVYWTQNRPLTPSGLPIIGKTAIDGLYLNVGHGSLGYTFAAASAEIVADLIGKTDYAGFDDIKDPIYAG